MIDIGFNLKRAKEEFYEICSNPIPIRETAKDGKILAELTCTFQNTADKEYYRVLQETVPWLQYAHNRDCVDGIVIESNKLDRSKANLYIVELKTSMGALTWNHVKNQFRGATLRAFAVATAMGINAFEEVTYITAYVEAEELEEIADVVETQKNIEGFAARKQLPGVKREVVREWRRSAIQVFSEQPIKFQHRHVHLQNVAGINVAHMTL